jgi:hypothetical protein
MPYDDRYYKRHRVEYHDWEKRLATDFFVRYGVSSVIDLGCGVGSYLDAAYDLGMTKIKGYELNLARALPHVPIHLRECISLGDVTTALPDEPHDCCWSVEVGEHLEPSGTLGFADNLAKLTSRLLLLTCAPPGQGGTAHINLRPKEDWVSLLCQRGLTYLPDDVAATADRWTVLGAPGYIVRNLMIFAK